MASLVAGEESGGLAQSPGGDEIGTVACDGGAGAVANNCGGQGDDGDAGIRRPTDRAAQA